MTYVDMSKIDLNDGRHFIAAGSLYYIGDKNVREEDRGFCGDRFIVMFLHSEKVVITRNLWYNGPLSDEDKIKYPATATFLKEDNHGR